MPRFKYIGHKQVAVNGIDDRLFVLNQDEFDTYDSTYAGDPDFTKVSDEPFFNPVVDRNTVTAAGAENVSQVLTGLADTEYVWVEQISDGITVSVFLQDATNDDPVLSNLDSTVFYAPIQIRNLDGNLRADTLIFAFSGAGSCVVTEYKE